MQDPDIFQSLEHREQSQFYHLRSRRGIWQVMSAGRQTSLAEPRTACLHRLPFHPFPNLPHHPLNLFAPIIIACLENWYDIPQRPQICGARRNSSSDLAKNKFSALFQEKVATKYSPPPSRPSSGKGQRMTKNTDQTPPGVYGHFKGGLLSKKGVNFAKKKG